MRSGDVVHVGAESLEFPRVRHRSAVETGLLGVTALLQQGELAFELADVRFDVLHLHPDGITLGVHRHTPRPGRAQRSLFR